MKKIVFLGLLMVGVLGGCVSSPQRGHNYYYIYGDYRLDTQGTEFIFFNYVPNSRMRLFWDTTSLCVVKGGPCDTTALCSNEKFLLLYKASPRAGYSVLSLSVEISDETESRLLHKKPFVFMLPVYYSGMHSLVFSEEEGDIIPEIKSSGERGYFSPWGYYW